MLASLTHMFRISSNADIEYYISQLIRCGWIGVGSDYPDDTCVLSKIIAQLLNNYLRIVHWKSLFRIARQLLALGLFRQRGASLFHFSPSPYYVRSLEKHEFFLWGQSSFKILSHFSSCRARRSAESSRWTTSSAACGLSSFRLYCSSTSGEPMRCLKTWLLLKAPTSSHSEMRAKPSLRSSSPHGQTYCTNSISFSCSW